MEKQFLTTVMAGLAVYWIVEQYKSFKSTNSGAATFDPAAAIADLEAASETMV